MMKVETPFYEQITETDSKKATILIANFFSLTIDTTSIAGTHIID